MMENKKNFISQEERTHIVRFCMRIARDIDAAEDLTQETLLEAWCHKTTLRDQTRRISWLLGIAHNVCLRWLRKHGREGTRVVTLYDLYQQDMLIANLEDILIDDFDIEVEFERKELVELVDRALARLPLEVRTLLVQHYIEDTPLAEIATLLGTNAHALAMRLQRGKLAFRRVITHEMQEIALYYLPPPMNQWEHTPLWCSHCGCHRLLGKRMPSEGKLLLKCPTCSPGADETILASHFPVLQGVKGYKALFSRFNKWCDSYYRTGLRDGSVVCETCDHLLPVTISHIENLPYWASQGRPKQWKYNNRVVSTLCSSCDTSCTNSLESLVLSLPEGRQFQQTSPRIRTLPTRQVEVNGRPALVTSFESITDTTSLTVVSAYDTYEVLRVYREGR